MCMGWEVFHMYTLSNEEFNGKIPQIDPNAFVAPQVFLSGDVRIGKYASVWPGVVARGDVNYISIGECTNVQDLVCLHVADDDPCIIAIMSLSGTAPASMPVPLMIMSSSACMRLF